MTTTTEGTYQCPECGRQFSTRFALGGHMTGHKAKDAPDPEPERGAYEAQVWTTLREMAEPLRSQLGELDARLAAVEEERSDLRKARAEIVGVLSKLDPTMAKPTKKKTANVVSANAERATAQQRVKTEALADYFEKHPEEFVDGFTANVLAARLSDRIPRGLSNSTARTALEALRERGIVRADRVVKGGGMQWKLVANGDGNG